MSRTAASTNIGFYVAGGTLHKDARCYAVRSADKKLYETLSEGHFAYVLTSRQMGKSSLMVRTAERLRKERFAVAIADLSAIGQTLDADQWYFGLSEHVAEQLGFSETDLLRMWAGHPHYSPLRRWTTFLQELLHASPEARVIIFIDEIDTVRSLPFPTDEFFAGIRQFYNCRAIQPSFERLTFCLLGVAAPTELIKNPLTTPFNIGVRIELNDFSESEAAPLAAGLGTDDEGRKQLARVLHWTGGHPYLTQRLCQAVASMGGSTQAVDEACGSVFLGRGARENDDNLVFVRNRILHNDVDTTALLKLYKRVLLGRKVGASESNPLITVLRLSGLCRAGPDCLHVRNRIYARVFDRHWIESSMPDAERRREYAAFRRGFLLASVVAVAVFAVIAGLLFLVGKERDKNRRALYIADLRLAQQSLSEHDMSRVNELLRQAGPQGRERDLRGFEWYALWNLSHAHRPAVTIPGNAAYAVFSPDGEHIFASMPDGLVELNSRSGTRVAVRLPWASAAYNIAISPDSRFLSSWHSIKVEPFPGQRRPFGNGSALENIGLVNIVDLRSGALYPLQLPGAVVKFVAERGADGVAGGGFSSDGSFLISAIGPFSIIWQAPDWAPRLIRDTGEVIRQIVVSRDRRYYAFSTRTAIEVWTVDSSTKIASLPANQPGALAFCPDTTCVAWGDYGPIRIFDFRTSSATA